MINQRKSLYLLGISVSMVCSIATADELPDADVTRHSSAIDRLMAATHQELGVRPNDVIDDATFVRRAYIQIIGRIPTVDETEAFFNDQADNKRHALIDRLVASSGFRHKLFNFYADLLRLRTPGSASGVGWHVWLKEAVEQNRPYDEMVHEMLSSSSGHASENPAVGYYLRDRDNLLDNVSNTVMVFLGMEIACAQCHDDPFGETTQLQYYQLAAYSGGIAYKSPFTGQAVRQIAEATAPGTKNVDRPSGLSKKEFTKFKNEVEKDLKNLLRPYSHHEILQTDSRLKLPHDYQYSDGDPLQVVEPATFLGTKPDVRQYDNPRQAFAAWVVSPDNHRFCETIVNRLWSNTFGGGLREPVDNWNSSDKVPHPRVLETLVNVLQDTDFDIRETMRVMYHTQLFQRAVTDEEIAMGTVSEFRGPALRRMTGEEIFDSLQTMQYGNLDDATNTDLREHWQNYASDARDLRAASPQIILAVDDALDAAGKVKGQKKKAFKDLKARISAARKAGDTVRLAELERLKKERDKASKLKPKSTPDESRYARMARVLSSGGAVQDFSPRLRSSEMPSPLPLGSIVRRFGGSDRETVNAGHTNPSIPQVLTMLNGEHTEKITRRDRPILQAVQALKTSEARVNRLFLQFYSCLPTESENKALQPMMSKPDDIATVARAMLSSKRFLFVR